MKLFTNKTKLSNVSDTIEVKGVSNKTDSETTKIVKEIHNTFFTEYEKLLADAKIMNSLETTQQALLDKAKKLKSLGFINTKEVIKAQEEISRLDKLKKDNEKKQDIIDAINYFSVKYPQYKFITEKSVKTICKKYGLIYGEVSKYKGTVPEENIAQIQEFKIKDKDIVCAIHYKHRPTEYISLETYKQNINNEIEASIYNYGNRRKYELCSLEIVAPPSDFDLRNSEVEDFKLIKKEIPDPIVLQPVLFKNQKHYLIVTAWGPEATDKLVINEKFN